MTEDNESKLYERDRLIYKLYQGFVVVVFVGVLYFSYIMVYPRRQEPVNIDDLSRPVFLIEADNRKELNLELDK